MSMSLAQRVLNYGWGVARHPGLCVLSFPRHIETLYCLSQLGKFYLEKMVGFEKSDTAH